MKVWGHPHCSSPSSIHFASIQYSNALSPICLSNSSLRSQLQTNQPTKVLTGGGDLREAQVDVPLSVSHSCV